MGAPGRWPTLLNARGTGTQFERMAFGTAEGLEGARRTARQYRRGARLLGADWAAAGQIQLGQCRSAGEGGARAQSACCAALVWDVEERQHALRPPMGEGRSQAVSTRDSCR